MDNPTSNSTPLSVRMSEEQFDLVAKALETHACYLENFERWAAAADVRHFATTLKQQVSYINQHYPRGI